MPLVIKSFDYSDSFSRDVGRAPEDVVEASKDALKKLKEHAAAGSLRLHPLKGYGMPTIFKIDVLANCSWQLTFELDGDVAILRRLATHKQIDRRPR